MTETRQFILKTLVYFDIFHYPLLKEELARFHGKICTPGEIETELQSLLRENRVFYIDGFYSLHSDIKLAAKRRRANKLAAGQMVTALKASKILSGFPFVRGLAISGSLSKNYGTEEADIDFFIITAANRLWVARTIMHCYKKLMFLTGRQNWFCMNYYVDEAEPEIAEKNVYTATEIITLIPMFGKKALEHFMMANSWARNYFPLHPGMVATTPELKKGFSGRIIEKIFSGWPGNLLDNALMKITDKRWAKKEHRQKKNEKGIRMGMSVSKHVSKPNPLFFQNMIVKQYQDRVNRILMLQNSRLKVE